MLVVVVGRDCGSGMWKRWWKECGSGGRSVSSSGGVSVSI